MFIILEGPDGAGKTTLARELASSVIDHRAHHKVPPQGDAFAEYELPLEDIPEFMPIICDRWHLGEMVYGPIFRGQSIVDDVARWHIESRLHTLGALQVVLIPELDVLQRRLAVRGDDMVKIDQLAAIRDAYINVVPGSIVPTMICTLENPNDAINVIIQQGMILRTNAHALRPYTTYTGVRYPDYLILGERRNNQDEEYSAAFVPAASTSGRYLLEHLIHPMGDKTFGLANALEENVEGLWHALDMPKVVTLGNLAHEKLERIGAQELGFDWGSVPHPQYVRRFHHKSGALYARTLISAADTSEDLRSWRPA